MIVVRQDPDAHKFYEVDWTTWLSDRGYVSADVISYTWSVVGAAQITGQGDHGVFSRVYLKGATAGSRSTVTCRITVPNQDGGPEQVKDDYSFQVVGQVT